ncbi:hypothetical protein J6590_036522 [Homalodisca vitripennis]|nr:hypothetical protein J6590_036522 [Homalodisca vitripennis]
MESDTAHLSQSLSPGLGTEVTVCNQTHTGEHPVTMRSLLSPLPRADASPAPRTPPAAPAPACSTPSAPTTPTAVPSTDSIPDPSALPAPDPSQLLADNQALNQKIHDIQQQMKVILDHSIESDQRLLEFTDQVFVARSAVNVPSSPHQSRDQYCQTSDNYQHPCERTVSIVGDSHARHLAGMMRAMVDGDTDVSGTCKPGAGLLNTTPDPAPPPGNCFVLVSGNNDVAAGRQNIIFSNLEEVNKNCRMTSKVLITPLFPRYDLPPDSPIQKNIRIANAYISELCVRREGVEMVDISRIGRQFFTAQGQHLRARNLHKFAAIDSA